MRKRKLLLALMGLAAVASAASVVAPRAEALPKQSVVVFYFDDAAHTNLVGEKNITCNGEQFNWGQQTPYFVSTTEPCGGGCSPFPTC